MQPSDLRTLMDEVLDQFRHLHRLSGSPQAEQSAAWLLARLQQLGLQPEMLACDLLLSDPVAATLSLPDSPDWQPTVKTRSFSGHCPQGVEAVLFHDSRSLQRLCDSERGQWQESVRGRIVIADQAFEDYVQQLDEAGAAGLIHIWGSAEDALHEETVGPIWGTPVADDRRRYPLLPVISLNQRDGRFLLEAYQQRPGLTARLSTTLNNHVARCSLPVVDIPGQSPAFVLLSSHYDSWHEGVTDNATGNALCLAVAAWAASQQGQLQRGLRIAWWPGHSNARYGGSTWYADRYRQQLQQHCVAHVNVDSPGCRDALQVVINASGAESASFLHQAVQQVTGHAAQRITPLGKGADQSFWGCGIPLHFAFREQPLVKTSQSPGSGGGWWWHTEEDTFDKVDRDILWRDLQIHQAWLSRLLNSAELPLDPASYLSQLHSELSQLQSEVDPIFDLQPIAEQLLRLQARFTSGPVSESALRRATGLWHRVRYSASDDFHYDLSYHGGAFPGLQRLAGHYQHTSSAAFFLMLTTQFYRQRDRALSLLEHSLQALE